jgi:16S rRNA (guanine527-N7)-methyltransferase
VKHPINAEEAEAIAIARETLALLDTWFAGRGVVPPHPNFRSRIEKFAAALAFWGARINLTSQPDVPTELAFHILDSLMPLIIDDARTAIREGFTHGRKLLDLGSGAGFPGLVLAAAADGDFTLVETRRKRASFLTLTAAAMDLHNVVVEPLRGDSPRFARGFDTVIARAFSRPSEFLRMAAAALRPSGRAILFASPGQALDPEAALSAGLGDEARRSYELERPGVGAVPRILAVWRKL